MHRRKSKIILVYFFLLIAVSSISNNSFKNYKLGQIQNINISGLDQKNNEILLGKLKNLKKENIFFIDKNEIFKLINSNPLVEKYEVFKKYPYTINIKIEKTSYLAKINIDDKTFLIGSNGKLTSIESEYSDLPHIFGKPSIKEFFKFKKKIDKSKFSYNQIKKLYFFPSKRWDLKLSDDILLKLPNNFTNKTLDSLYEFLENYSGGSFNIVDARIQRQIILNE
tara:strand:- start:3380 stop:4051 length:672 start_codon:yes stop_codon:yes gene_type:complete